MVPARPRLVSYLRASTDSQDRSGLGLEAQRQAVAAYVTQAGGDMAAEFRELPAECGIRIALRRPGSAMSCVRGGWASVSLRERPK